MIERSEKEHKAQTKIYLSLYDKKQFISGC
jgi:hypothetical protein